MKEPLHNPNPLCGQSSPIRIASHVLIRELPGRFKGLATLCHAAAAKCSSEGVIPIEMRTPLLEAYDITTGLLERLHELRRDIHAIMPPPDRKDSRMTATEVQAMEDYTATKGKEPILKEEPPWTH